MCMCMCVCMRVVAAVARLLVGERGVAHEQLEELRGARNLRPPRLWYRCGADAVQMEAASGAHPVRMRCTWGGGHAAGPLPVGLARLPVPLFAESCDLL